MNMTKIKDILSIRLEDDIKSVIDLNQQDESSIMDELDGFILTESLAKHLADFCDFFTSNTAQPGLWLSGFYGSGKSYFSKMIGFLLKNPSIQGTSVRDRFPALTNWDAPITISCSLMQPRLQAIMVSAT